MRIHMTKTVVAAGVLSAALAACSADNLTRPDLNNPSPDGLVADPLSGLNQLAGGIIAQQRDQAAGWATGTGILGRESFNYTGTEGRNTTGWLVNPDDYTSFGGGGLFQTRYINLRNIFIFNDLVESTNAITTAQKEASRGFARTMEAVELFYVILRDDTQGAPVEVYAAADSVAPFVSRDSVYKFVVARLTQGATSLAAGGTAFPFALSTGYSGFNTPATFVKFNQAMLAKVQAVRGSIGCGVTCYQAALTALGNSFIDPAGSLTTGVYSVFSTASGSTINGATTFGGQARVIVAHPSIVADAPKKPDGTPDNRLLAKTTTLASPVSPSFCATTNCLPTSVGFTIYPAQDSPLPLIRNEELILLRAEARYFTGDVAGALADLNVVRTRAGGLAPITQAAIATSDQFVTELLLQRRYSLLYEGDRWVDVRRFNRLNTLPLDRPNNKVVSKLPVPQTECLVRSRRGTAALAGTGCPEAGGS
jgi:hypothetical protein